MNQRHAFTLVEMIVALAITALLTVLMLRMFMDSSTIWKASDERLETFREARAALQLMARELGTVNAAPDLPEDFPILALQPHPDTGTEDQVNQEVYALTSTRNRGKGDLCAVGYFCRWDEVRKTFALQRFINGSDSTFANLKLALNATTPMPGVQAFATLFGRVHAGAAGEDGDENAEINDIATYVWDLEFAVADRFDPTLGVEWPDNRGTFARELPQWIEIRFKALGSSAARKLEGQAVTRDTWFDKEAPLRQRLILPNEQQFITRVKLSR